jgi:hypothetical protein
MTGVSQNADFSQTASTGVGSADSANTNNTSPTESPQLPRAQQRIGPYVLGKTLGVGSTGKAQSILQ